MEKDSKKEIEVKWDTERLIDYTGGGSIQHPLTKIEIDLLEAPFPDEAYTTYPSKGMRLTTLKAAYIMERLHDVFGMGNVTVRYNEPIVHDGFFVASGQVVIYHAVTGAVRRLIPFCGMGSMPVKMSGIEDEWKGTVTNAINKALFNDLQIGREMFKGKIVISSDGRVTKPEKEDLSVKMMRATLKALKGADLEALKACAAKHYPGVGFNDLTDAQIKVLYDEREDARYA